MEDGSSSASRDSGPVENAPAGPVGPEPAPERAATLVSRGSGSAESAPVGSESIPERAATFREVFSVAEFRVLFAGQLLMVLGESVKMLAVSVLVYTQTESAGLSAAAYMIGFLPHAVGGVFLLSLADRLRPRPVIVAGEILRVAVCLVLAFAGLSVWAMLAVVLVTSVPASIFAAARNAILPDMLAGDGFVLGRAIFTMTAAGAQIAGMAVGGGVLALIGPNHALLLTASLSGCGALVLRFGLKDRAARAVAAKAGVVRASLRVNAALLADRRVRGLMLAGWVPIMFMVGAEAVFIPYFTERGTASAAGIVLAVTAAGMGVGEFVVGRFAPPALRERLTLPLVVLLGLPLLGFLAEPGPLAAAGLAFLAGSALSYNLGLQRRFVEAVPGETLGQAFGLSQSGMMTCQALGGVIAGGLAELTGPAPAIALSGVAVLLSAIALRKHLYVGGHAAVRAL
ncbi:MFS transporter [Acrocarpospora pleiomorpha]|uniref:MFS transporter n=1 Tax=Acrocarpospora pleiomorpha TaxID=90975 RepID=A0A5M3XJQ6_9ACTN|nr:MFS transporter [Acrocarpospora pleiomorpha]GES21190.1 MFS transporter [Acrocarpospora pleiomorpha]